MASTSKAKKDKRPGVIEAVSPSTQRLPARAALPMHERDTEELSSAWQVGLALEGSDQHIDLNVTYKVTFGRQGLETYDAPHIDLTPHSAREKGVSRMHAEIAVRKNCLSLSDLGSTNGTFLNGYQVQPFTDVPLKNGDLIELGDLKLRLAKVSQLTDD